MIERTLQSGSPACKNPGRISAQTDCTESEEREEELLNRQGQEGIRYTVVESEDIRFYRVNLFNDTALKKPSSKLNRSAVGWIQATCFMRGLDAQASCLATALYYAYISAYALDKSRLECVLVSATLLAHKFCSPRTLRPGSLQELANGKFSIPELLEMETRLLELMGMDLIVETVLDFVCDEQLPRHIESGVLFLIELLLLKDATILFDEDKARMLINLVEDPIREGPELAEFQDLLNCNQTATLRRKYMSIFEVDQLILKLQR